MKTKALTYNLLVEKLIIPSWKGACKFSDMSCDFFWFIVEVTYHGLGRVFTFFMCLVARFREFREERAKIRIETKKAKVLGEQSDPLDKIASVQKQIASEIPPAFIKSQTPGVSQESQIPEVSQEPQTSAQGSTDL